MKITGMIFLGLVVIVIAVFAVSILWPRGERPFLMIQLCVMDEQGVTSLKQALREIAMAENMTFVDHSNRVTQQYESIASGNPEFTYTRPVVYYAVRAKDGSGLTASNTGLDTYQIAIGFSERNEPKKSREFAETVTNTLKQYWTVETIPAGKGAFPMGTCN